MFAIVCCLWTNGHEHNSFIPVVK